MSRRAVVVAVGFVALLALASFFGRSLSPAARARFPSSYAAEPEGLLAFRRLLVELEIPTRVVARPWDKRFVPGVEGLLLVATPLQRQPDLEESAALQEWLERGGALLVFDDATLSEQSTRLGQLLDQLGIPAQRPAAAWDDELLVPARPGTRRAFGTPARPSDPSLERVVVNDRANLAPESEAVPLAVTSDGRVVSGHVPVGDGGAVRVMGAIVSNDRLLEGDNLELALRLVDDLRGGGPVWFDEFHHGYGGALPARRLNRSALAIFGFQTLAAGLLFALARGVRFGPARPERQVQRRSGLEFVHSMASLYRRARAERHAVAQARRRFEREARVRWSLPEELTGEAFARAVAQRGGLPPERVVETLRRAAAASAATDLGEREMVRQVRELSQLEKEIFGERATGS